MTERKNKIVSKDIEIFLRKNGFHKIDLSKNRVGHYQVTIRINGKRGRFIIDTGASGTVIDNESADKFNLNPKVGAAKAGGLGTTNLNVQKSKNNTITIGKIEINRFHVNKSLTAKRASAVDGVIGADILNRKKAIIDYGNSTLYLK
jgi:clan AA aspartic protease (TIGR02281 family)